MRILMDIDEMRFSELLAKNNFPGKVLGTEKNMLLSSVFSSADIWKRATESQLDKEELQKVEAFGRDNFLEAVISRLDHNFDANDGINWFIVDSAIQDTFDIYCSQLDKDQSKEQPENKTYAFYPLDGLHKAFERYEEDGSFASCGDWRVYRSSSLFPGWWELTFADEPVARCDPSEDYSRDGQYGNIKRLVDHISDKTFTDLCDIIQSVCPLYRMDPEEKQKIQARSQAQGR